MRMIEIEELYFCGLTSITSCASNADGLLKQQNLHLLKIWYINYSFTTVIVIQC